MCLTWLDDCPCKLTALRDDLIDLGTHPNGKKDRATLTVSESELYSTVYCAQDMLHEMKTLESKGLTVKKPMIVEMGNMGAVNLANNWSKGGSIRQMDARQHFLKELQEQSLLQDHLLS